MEGVVLGFLGLWDRDVREVLISIHVGKWVIRVVVARRYVLNDGSVEYLSAGIRLFDRHGLAGRGCG